jgi:hypothetical protein
MSPNLTQTLSLVARIFISVCMLAFGAYLLITGKLRISKYSVKGLPVRIISAVILLGSAIYFLSERRGFFHKYSPIVQLVLLLTGVILLWILAEKPTGAAHLPADTHTYKSGPDEPAYRLHLRLLKDGSGILIINAATVLRLNATAAEFAYHMMKGLAPDKVARQVSDRYQISLAQAHLDYQDFRDRIQTLIHTPDLDPTTYLDFERVAPHSLELTAPLRLDCDLSPARRLSG